MSETNEQREPRERKEEKNDFENLIRISLKQAARCVKEQKVTAEVNVFSDCVTIRLTMA